MRLQYWMPTAAFSESSCSVVSSISASAMSNAYSVQRECEAWPLPEKRGASSHAIASQSSVEKLSAFHGTHLNLASLLVRSMPRYDARKDQRIYRGNVKKVSIQQPFHSSFALKKTLSLKAAMEFDFPNLQYILDTLIG